jgi:hypothetical protein
MRFTGNEYKGEKQIIDTLKEVQKYTDGIDSNTFLKKVEQRLFTQKMMPWSDIKKRAATLTVWPEFPERGHMLKKSFVYRYLLCL